jgi:hypothetical protein
MRRTAGWPSPEGRPYVRRPICFTSAGRQRHGRRWPHLAPEQPAGAAARVSDAPNEHARHWAPDGPQRLPWGLLLIFGSLWSHRKTRGPRDRAPSAYLRFSFFVFRLPDPLFKRERKCGASIWSRPQCMAGLGSARHSATSFSRRSSVRRCGSTGLRCGIGFGSGSEIGRSPLRSIRPDLQFRMPTLPSC